MSRPGWWLLLAGLLGTAWSALAPGDVALAEHEWRNARLVKGEAFGDLLYVHVARAQRDVSPWQHGAETASRRLRRIAWERRRLLSHDRGGRRHAEHLVGVGEG